MSGTEAPAPDSDNGAGTAPRIQIVAQYIKDLSFENPGAPANMTARPAIDLGVDLGARRLD
ncbi:MAG TPA: protein-export chaperone SecB, partial [Rhizomicrobium sp.]